MNRLKIVSAALLLLGVLAGAAMLRPAGAGTRRAWWTDGREIRVAALGAPVREILWQPAARLGLAGPAGTVSGDEYEPRHSADGTTLVFVRGRPGGHADLYTSRWTPAGWQEPAPIEAVNTAADELGPELSRDGASLYFYSDRDGGSGGYDLWVSHNVEGRWGTPANLGPRVNSRWNEYGPGVTPEGDRLFFSSNRPRPGEAPASSEGWTATIREHRTRHDYDLYVAPLSGGVASEAEALTSLNTPSDEGAPAVSPSGDFLYFASDRAGGLGGFDLYRARIGTDARLGVLENLGAAVNSRSNDLDPALSSDGFRLCFSSDRKDAAPADVTTSAQAAPPDEPGRYALWWSVSREVYRDDEVVAAGPSALWAAWNQVWPWLLLFLLTLIPLLLLYYLLRQEHWRRRFGRLSLLAQCLLISLIAHALLASAFTVWKVGSGIIDLIHDDGGAGGVRVVLAAGSPGGGAAGQIRGLISGAMVAVPELETVAIDPVAPPAQVPRAEVTPPPLPAPSVTPLSVPIEPRAERAPSAEPAHLEPVARAPITDSSPTPGSPAREERHAEAQPISTVAEWSGPATPDAEAAGVGMVSVPLPRLRAEGRGVALAVSASPGADRESGTAGRPTAPTALAGAPEVSLPAATGSGVRVAEASMPAGAGSTELPIVVATPGPTEVAEQRFTTSLVPMASPASDQAAASLPRAGAFGLDAAERSDAGVAGSNSALPAPEAVAAGSVPSPGIPQVATRGPEGAAPASEAVLPRARGGDTSIVAAPVGSIGSPSQPGGATVNVDPGRMSRASSESGPGVGSVLPAPSPAGSSVGASASGPAPGPAPAPIGDLMVRLPSAPDPATPTLPTPGTPGEDFTQRAPETRAELVRKMGGSDETEKAVGRALDWFARHQETDGRWSAAHFDKSGRCGGAAEFEADAAMTGMVLLCYLGAGHTHTEAGPYQGAVERGIRWLLARQTTDGDLRQGETMYGQTVATVALCEALAMTRDPALDAPTRRAVAFVLARAANGGGASTRDTSVLGWLVFTVESARRAGIEVPRATFDAASRWLDRVAVPGTPGRYAYAPGQPASGAMTAEAMFVRQLLGHGRDEPMMEESARYVSRTPPRWEEGAPTHSWYYATLALFQHQGDAWKQWNEAMVRELLESQHTEGPCAGSWDPQDDWSRMGGRIYQTAVCTLSLEVYYRYRTQEPATAGAPAGRNRE
ncbi:MAG TPA: hypothetical protein VD963_07630 [Phycisphaerales bacterium]|nr:hypothetical protein [Phycisphaerales bacterium]